MSKVLIIGLIILAIGGGAVFWLVASDSEPEVSTSALSPSSDDNTGENDDASNDNSAPGETTGEGMDSSEAMTYTLADVATHASSSDCWTVINNKVYDLTSYIPQHPGGDEVLRACGKDGTSLFTQRTTEDGETVGSGTPHSGSATAQLQTLYVGDLAR